MRKQPGIYQIRNIGNEKIYIGSAVDLSSRFSAHLHMLRKGKHYNVHLQRSFKKYGESSFFFEPLLSCDRKDLIFFEQLVIDAFVGRYGWHILYNLSPTAGSSLGRKCSEETKAKISAKNKGKNIGRKHTTEELKRMSESQKGRKFFKEHKRSISRGSIGKKMPPFTERHKMRISKSLKGHEVSKETRHKISKANKGRKHTEEAKKKIGLAFKGKPGTRLGIKNKPKTNLTSF